MLIWWWWLLWIKRQYSILYWMYMLLINIDILLNKKNMQQLFLITLLTLGRKAATLPTAEILSGKNARAFLVCGFLMKSFKKNILKIWKKSWEPFGSYLLNSTANPAHFHPNWAGLAVLFSRQLLNGSQDFFFVLIFSFSFIFLNIKPLRPMPAHFCHLIFQM